MHHPTDRIAHTTAFVAPVVEREIAQWVHPMKDQMKKEEKNMLKIFKKGWKSNLSKS